MKSTLSDLLPRLVNEGSFGDCSYVSYSLNSDYEVGAHFASQTIFATLVICLPNKEEKTIPIVIKRQLPNNEEIELRDTGSQFYNEVVMYREIIPFLDSGRSRLYPRMYYGSATGGENPDDDMVIMENLNDLGYRAMKEMPFLSFDHISVVMERLGEFHSWSYSAKKSNNEFFFKKLDNLKSLNFKANDKLDVDSLILHSVSFGINCVINKNKDSTILNDFLKAIDLIPRVLELLSQPEDPFGILCHGDFCCNNVLFKYNDEGLPIDCVFFDYQQSRYSNPAIDLSFFLYMHTTSEVREQHWDELLETYYKSFYENIPKNIFVPEFTDFLNYFAPRAVYGFIISSFFLPIMMREKPLKLTEIISLSREEQEDYFANAAGEAGNKAVCDIVSHLLEKEYIHRFLELNNNSLS